MSVKFRCDGQPGRDDFARKWLLPGIFEKFADDYRPVVFEPTVDGNGAGPTPMVRTRYVGDMGLRYWSHPGCIPTNQPPAGRMQAPSWESVGVG